MHRHITVPQMYNMRDLGGLPTHTGQMTPHGVFWRGDSPHHAAAQVRDILLQHQITTVIDMRQSDECAKYPNPLIHDTEIHYIHVPLLVGRGDTLAITTLRDFYVHIIDMRQSAIATVLNACATAPAGVYFHCQLGKDRTGIISALLLLLAGVAEGTVIADYAETTNRLHPLVTKLQAERPPHIPEDAYIELLSAHPDTMQHLLTHIRTQYGDIAGYLASIDLAPTHIDTLRAKLR